MKNNFKGGVRVGTSWTRSHLTQVTRAKLRDQAAAQSRRACKLL